ncbi:MAG: lysophospholipid acyltransferase family protein [Bacilli bacterium]|nr:lysophospholipid acyltransferase family protein [Bacilli bacterium]MDD4733792.1 lysophospholipid acyltransferase family protein [Bacilli bacterium]
MDDEREYKKIKEASDSFMEKFYDLEVYGNYNIPDEWPAILVGEYQTHADVFTLLYSTLRRICFITKESVPDVLSLKEIQEQKEILHSLKENKLVNLFLNENQICTYRDGVFSLAREIGIPVIPYGINGTYKLGSKITIKFGEAINFKGCSPELMDKTLEEKIKKLSE